jgi:hypothetical protein
MPKPIDRWLGLFATAVGVGVNWMPKTPVFLIGSFALIFLLLIHPVWNFWWIEKSSFRRWPALITLAFCIFLLGYFAWPNPLAPVSQPPIPQDAINIKAFDSKIKVVLYNSGSRNVFVSHLSLRSEKFSYSGTISIHKLIESKGFLVQDLKEPTEDLSKWGTGHFVDDFWEKIILKSNLVDTKCIKWHFFHPDDPSYQTIKRFLGDGFRTVPINATLYFHSSLDGHLISQNLEIFAVPFLNQIETCGAPRSRITLSDIEQMTLPPPKFVKPQLKNKVSQPNSGKEPPVVDVALRFVYPKSPALMIKNLSDSVARDIKWTVLLWNMDLPDRNDPLPIPVQVFDWLKGHTEGGPQDLFSSPPIATLLKPGNRLFGSASVDCPTCSRGRTYIVYIIWGQGGWFSESEHKKSGDLIVPKNFLRDGRAQYFEFLSALSPEKSRLPIGER